MGFATRHDLIARSNARRVAQLATPADINMVPDDMLRVAITDGDLSGYTDEQREAMQIALDTMDKCLVDADALLISYGIPEEVQSTLLARLASTVAMYYLQQGERMTEAMQQAYDDVVKLLGKHARGEINLVPLPEGEEINGLAMIGSQPPRYGVRRQS